jgi:hypothetical protein
MTEVYDIEQDPKTLVFSPKPGSMPVVATLQVAFNPNIATTSLALMPTISGVNLQNDKNQLIVSGDFGGDYNSRSITIDGMDVTANATWTSGQITVNNLAPSGPGSGGNIMVTIDGLQSNHVLLNEWNNVSFTMTVSPQSNENRVDACNMNFRASFDTVRSLPDTAPDLQMVISEDPVLPPTSGQCQLTDTLIYPGAVVAVPWITTAALATESFPSIGTNAVASGEVPATGDYTLGITWQFSYTSILDTSNATLMFDATTQNLAAGSNPGGGNSDPSVQWSAATADKPADPTHAR